jgi:folylpolyglutamate synthase
MCESILRHKGFKTGLSNGVGNHCGNTGVFLGLFTSPHLIHVRERFRVGGQPVPEETFLKHFWSVWDGLHATAAESPPGIPVVPSFFRFLTLVAFRMFSAENVDVLLLEVGMGGK